jgi:hypothetical protein
MPIRPIIDNIITGAEAAGSGAANRARSVGAAARRVDQMGEALGVASDIIKNPEVMASLPEELRARVQLGEPAAMLEATMRVMRGGGIPQNIPRDRSLSKFPGGDSGFQMGAHGGRVPVASAGELIPAGQRELMRNPGGEAGFQMGGDIPPQNFDPTGLVPQSGGPLVPYVDVRTRPRRQDRGINPLMIGAGAAAAGVGGKMIYDYMRDGSDVDVAPEESVPEDTSGTELGQIEEPAAMPAQRSDLDAAVAEIMAARRAQKPFPYAETPMDPQYRTLMTLIDAGIEPTRADLISKGKLSMTEMEQRAVIENGPARNQRMQDEIQGRRNERMRGY